MNHVIREIMNSSVVTVRADATLADAVKTLVDQCVSGAPVVSPQGEVVGYIAEPEVMDVLFDADLRSAPVSEFMSRSVYLANPDDSLAHAARLFALFGVRRMPVVENGTLVGIVTRRDLLKYSREHSEPIADPLSELVPAVGQFA
jgi:tRNA nucleotidyltransferase (CCA-adding enzyme)